MNAFLQSIGVNFLNINSFFDNLIKNIKQLIKIILFLQIKAQ